MTHEKYSFYNPKQHPYFDRNGGREIFFDGTYTQTFSGNPDRTPRYEYNQIMYKLDLADPRLNLPVAVYRREGESGWAVGLGRDEKPGPRPIAFFALERPGPATIPVFAVKGGKAPTLIVGAAGAALGRPLFHALAAGAKDPPSTTVPLYVDDQPDGKPPIYSTDEVPSVPGSRTLRQPLCRVWRNPLRLAFPPQ